MERVFVGITGASGHAYARALIAALIDAGVAVDIAVTRAGSLVLKHEEDVTTDDEGRLSPAELQRWLQRDDVSAVTSFGRGEVGAAPASGSALGRAAILCPTSMGTMARVAAGLSSNLVERVADVALKEGKQLILVARETPLSQIHLMNMLRLSRLGAVILPAAPGFYHRPKCIQDLLDQVVGKILRRIGIEPAARLQWTGLDDEPPTEEGVQ
jgi:flavin prenyltransferase